MIYRFFSIFCCFLISLSLLGQGSGGRIAQINFEGLTKTKPGYIKGLLHLHEADAMDVSLLAQDVQILKNFPSVIQATVEVDTTAEGINLTYQIEERRTALPIINFGGIRGNIWFSVGATDSNFTGRGDLALGYYQNNNGRHTGELFYRRTRFDKSNWGGSVSLRSWASQEPLFFEEGTIEYLYDNNAIGITAIWNKDIHNQLEFGGTFFKEVYRQADEQEMIPTTGPKSFSLDKLLGKIQFSKNHLRYHFIYLEGYEFIARYQLVHSINGDRLFNSLWLQAKTFWRPIKRINLATRTIFAISTNSDSPFAPFVADSHVNIRGIGNRIDRGTAQAILNVELRYTLSSREYWSSQAVVYSDAGTWREPGGQLSDLMDRDQFRHFVGLGFRVSYQKFFGATLRIDYGLDLYNSKQKGLVVGLGQYF